jgi:hypothetical protein
MTNIQTDPIVLRPSRGEHPEIRRLAALDTADALEGAVLVAEVAGAPRAAISLTDGRVVADPFSSTTDLADLLRLRAQRLGVARPRRSWLRFAPAERRVPRAVAPAR